MTPGDLTPEELDRLEADALRAGSTAGTDTLEGLAAD